MDLPLFEDDLGAAGLIEAAAVRRPLCDRPGLDMPEAAVLCFFPEVVEAAGATARRRICRLSTEFGRTPVWEVESGGGRVAVMHPGVGAPLAAMFLEDLIALGARRFVAVGGAGALLPELVLGHAVVVDSAVRDEGTSYHYLPPARVVEADAHGVGVLSATCDAAGVPCRAGRTWTTDAVYRETRARVERRRAEGCLVVEMEAAAFLAVARYRAVRFAHLLLAADSLAGPAWEHRGWTTAREARAGLFALAARAALSL
jgi:uridine phosphorylase